MVSSLTEQLHSHSASPMEDRSSHLSKGIWASHAEISPFVAWESGDERLLRPLTWVCCLPWDDDDITHHMYHLPAPGDHPGETHWATEITSYFRAFAVPVVPTTTTAEIPPQEFGSWTLRMMFTLKFQRRVTMLLQDYMQSEILCFYNKLVLKGFFCLVGFCPQCCTMLKKYLKMNVHPHDFCKSLVIGTLCPWETEVQT